MVMDRVRTGDGSGQPADESATLGGIERAGLWRHRNPEGRPGLHFPPAGFLGSDCGGGLSDSSNHFFGKAGGMKGGLLIFIWVFFCLSLLVYCGVFFFARVYGI